MCIRASVWVRSCICVRSIHTPFDDSHLLLSLSLRWLFGKINMNVRHILGSATQLGSYAVPSLLYPHFFCAYKFPICVIVLVSIYMLPHENTFRFTFRYWNWARACFYSWQFASDKNHFFASSKFKYALKPNIRSRLLNFIAAVPIGKFGRKVWMTSQLFKCIACRTWFE